MCNLYRQAVRQSDISAFLKPAGLALTEAARGRNVEPGYVGADQDGPVLVSGEEKDTLELETMRWGFPSFKDGGLPITNIRNLDSSWWKNVNGEYLEEPQYRCLVPFEVFAEWNREDKGNSWFEVDSPAPMFAGVWRPWRGERLKAVQGKKRRQRQVDDFRLYAFLTTEPNATVAAVHPRAMPVILTTPDECAAWMSGGSDTLAALQRPLPDEMVALA